MACDNSAAAPSLPPTVNQARISNEYSSLYNYAKTFNEAYPDKSNWSMNSEHCFEMIISTTGDLSDTLRSRVIYFVREPGSLDYIFARLLRRDVDNEEVLIDSQMLIYIGEHQERLGEKLPKSVHAAQVLDAVHKGIFSRAASQYYGAPIVEKITTAANRAIVDCE